MNDLFLYNSLFLLLLSLADNIGQLYYKNSPQKYYFRIISAVVYIIASSCFTFIFIPAVWKLSIYKLYIVPHDKLMYAVLIIWSAAVLFYTGKVIININKLHKGM